MSDPWRIPSYCLEASYGEIVSRQANRRKGPMKSYDSRTYGINDFVEWEAAKQLELNPRFQRRSVWSDKAKSYLIDTIMRGKPIPKVFIRQKINVSTKTSVREVVDGQQRLRTILSFVKDGFKVSKSHNKEYGGLLFSQLDENIQSQILAYEISVDILINLNDSEVLDIFGRLNSYAIVLNEQERLNAAHFGPFKSLSDEIARNYTEYWINQKIFTPNQVLRMNEVNLTADLLIALMEGIKAKRLIPRYYERYEKKFIGDEEGLTIWFDSTIAKIADMFPDGLVGTEFNRPFLFYTLFTSVAHMIAGLPGLDSPAILLENGSISAARNRLDHITEIFADKDAVNLSTADRTFLQDSTRATTDEAVRARRTNYVIDLLSGKQILETPED